ncbi:MAG TPA: hypothetical protein PLZ99_00710 [Parcubacteria group bacterium]|jgi:hypothetical protein|nr:hypothetical protein [Parcubacteria group bacterium]
MKTVLFFALFTLAIHGKAGAQTEITVDTTSYVPMVTVSDESFAGMCESFEKKLGNHSASGIVTFRPKTMPIGQDEKSGSIWILNSSGKTVEIASSELPAPLRKIRGSVARNVLQASCYTENMMFFGKRDVLIVTVDNADANAVAQALR